MPRIAQSGEVGCRKKTSNQWFETQDNIAYYEDFEKPKLIWAELARTGNSFVFETKQFSVLAGVFLMIDKNNDSRTLKYLNAILNNPIALFYLEKVYSKLDLTGWQWKKAPVEKIPIPKINAKNQKIADKIVNLVDKVLESKAQGKDSTTPPCHTTSHFCHTERSEVSQKQKRDFSHSTNAQNDKTIKNYNDTNNHNKDISHTLNIDTTGLESQIDKLVYQLYYLNQDEMKTIKSK